MVFMTAHFVCRRLLTFQGPIYCRPIFVVDRPSIISHGKPIIIGLYYILSIRGPEDFEFSFLSLLKPLIS